MSADDTHRVGRAVRTARAGPLTTATAIDAIGAFFPERTTNVHSIRIE